MLRLSTPKPDLEVSLYPEYEQRDVMTIIPVTHWATENELSLQLTHNRLLQQEYINENPKALIELAKATREPWLTDFVSLSVDAALYLNICAELLAFYQVNPHQCHELAETLFHTLKARPEFASIPSIIEDQVREQKITIRDRARQCVQQRFPELSAEAQQTELPSFSRLECERAKKEITHQVVSTYISRYLGSVCKVTKKPVSPLGENHDFCFLGAMASGKTTVAQRYIQDISTVTVLATDEYRGCYLPGTTNFETVETNQIFIRTQDTAFIIKERIKDRLEARKRITHGTRPDLYIDSMTLEGWHREMLAENRETSSNVVCVSRLDPIPERAYLRAKSSTSPGDHLRFANTTSLLDGHGKASKYLLSATPDNTKTEIYDTYESPVTEKSHPLITGTHTQSPIKKIGLIDKTATTCTTSLFRLDLMGNFLGKANVNTEADHTARLFYNPTLAKYRFTYDAVYKADALVTCLLPIKPDAKTYSVLIHQTGEEKACLKLNRASDGRLELEILDDARFKQLLSKGSKEQIELIHALLMLVAYGSPLKLREEVSTLGKKGAFFMAMNKLGLQQDVADLSAPTIKRTISPVIPV